MFLFARNLLCLSGACIFAATILLSCKDSLENTKEKVTADSTVIVVPDVSFYSYNPLTQYRPVINPENFDTLKDIELLQLLNDSLLYKMAGRDEVVFMKTLSPIQKTVIYFSQLDAEIRNGGVLQYYFNGYNRNLPLLRQGLQMVRDTRLLVLLKKADAEYSNNAYLFTNAAPAADFTELAEKLPALRKKLTDEYFKIADNSIALIVAEIRKKPNEIVEFN